MYNGEAMSERGNGSLFCRPLRFGTREGEAMTIFGVFNLLVVLLAALNITGAADSDVMAAMSKVFSSATGSGTSDSKSYFISHGKAMFHQASMLDFMTLAKLGRAREACDQLASQVIQTILADLPLRYQAVGDLMSLMQSDRSFFTKTMIAVQTNMKTVSKDIKDKLIAFMKTKKTNADKLRIRTEIENSIKDQGKALAKRSRKLTCDSVCMVTTCVHLRYIAMI